MFADIAGLVLSTLVQICGIWNALIVGGQRAHISAHAKVRSNREAIAMDEMTGCADRMAGWAASHEPISEALRIEIDRAAALRAAAKAFERLGHAEDCDSLAGGIGAGGLECEPGDLPCNCRSQSEDAS